MMMVFLGVNVLKKMMMISDGIDYDACDDNYDDVNDNDDNRDGGF